MEEKKTKEITPILRKMEVGEKRMWSTEQLTSVRGTIQRLQIVLRRSNVKYRTRVSGIKLIVERIS